MEKEYTQSELFELYCYEMTPEDIDKVAELGIKELSMFADRSNKIVKYNPEVGYYFINRERVTSEDGTESIVFVCDMMKTLEEAKSYIMG